MVTKHIFAVGRIDRGGHAIMVTKAQAEESAGAYVMGEHDAYAGIEARPLHYYTHSDLLCIESYLKGHQDAQPANGELQRMIDFGAELQEQQDARDDEEYHRSGNW